MVSALDEVLSKVSVGDLLKAIARETGVGAKHDATGTPIATGYVHGPQGLLSYPGVDPDVFTAMLGNEGIVNRLPTKPSVFTNPVYTTITGVQDDSGSEPNYVCDAQPKAGLKKACNVSAPFGRYSRETQEIDITRIGKFRDLADPQYLRLVNNPIGPGGLFGQAVGNVTPPGDILVDEISQKFWELAVALNRLLNVQIWTGSPANNSGGGGYMEIAGFQTLVNTGYVDLSTNTACANMDSDVKDFAYLHVDTNGAALVNALSYMYRYVKDQARRQGLMPVDWVFAMRPELFWEISAIWPCSYLTYQCNLVGANQQQVVYGSEQVRMRDEMRQGSYLLLNGDRIPVVQDDGIPEDTAGENANVDEGCFSSDVYLIPLSVMGGRAVSFLEYFDYQSNHAASQALSKQGIFTIQGPWIVIPSQTRACIFWDAIIEPRLVLRTPWLAGRLQHVQYCPLQHTKQPFPDDAYWHDGGVTYRSQAVTYNIWGQGAR
jgi:hypothetical protein